MERTVVRYLALEGHPSQARHMMTSHLATTTGEAARADAWVRAHLASRFSIDELARATRTSTRTLARRVKLATGLAPVRFVQRIRAEEAAYLLETTDLSLDEVAARVGYEDSSTLRRLLRREMGRGAREIRARRRSEAELGSRARESRS